MSRSYDAVVVGAGITGLAAAYELANRGARIAVLESSDRAGGLIFTEHVGGFTIEAGPDAMLSQKPAAIRLCEELGLGPRLIATRPPRTAFVFARGRLHPLPSPSVLGIPTTWRGLGRYDLLTATQRARMALEPLVPRARTTSDESVGSFFRRRFGGASVNLIAEPLLGGIHAGDVDALSIRSLFPRFVEAETRRGSVLREFRRTHSPSAHGLFQSLSPGMGELVASLARRLPAGTISLQTPAIAIEPSDGAWRIVTPSGALQSRAVVIAAPAHAAASMLAPVDDGLSSQCRQVPYVSTASVALAWPAHVLRAPLAGSGFVVARTQSDARITACTWVSSKWEGRAPENHVLLRVFIGGAHDPDAAALDDGALVDIARRDLSSILGIADVPLLTRVYRWIDAGAQHNVGHLARMERIDAKLAELPGLFVAGSGFRSIGIPDCVVDGRAAGSAAAQYAKIAERS